MAARTWEFVRRDLAAFHEEHGHRPTQLDLKNQDAWLARRGSSVAKLCDKMGLTGTRPVGGAAPAWKYPHSYDEKKVEERMRAFHREHGRRPAWADVKAEAEYLYRRGVSLTEFCDGLGLPQRRREDERP